MNTETICNDNVGGNAPLPVRKPYVENLNFILCIALVAITLAVYIQVVNHRFVNLDDGAYVTENNYVKSGITANSIVWAFISVDANWHPVTWLSHMADVQLFGLNPMGHHLTSVVIHSVSTVLLFLLLFRLTGSRWQSIFVAALFALHPLHVESVAWVSERKDMLSALFWFLTLIFYCEYVAKRKPALYLLALVSFVLGLMSKPMLVTLPIVLLLMDYWPLNRYLHEGQEQGLRQISGRLTAFIKEKIPFIAFSFFSCVITIYAQYKGGAINDLIDVPIVLRIQNALVAYVKYIIKTLWPRDLAVLYPITSSIPLWQIIGSMLVLLLLSFAAIRLWRRHPFFAVGWLWFLVTLLPVIGLVQVGTQSMADRYSYIPAIGLYIMAAWGVPVLIKKLRYREGVLTLLAGSIIIASASLTWQQLGYWRDSVSLFRHTLQVTTDNYLIHNNLGTLLLSRGDLDAAIPEFRDVLRIKPNDIDAHINLGIAFIRKGDLDEAVREFREVLRISPDDVDAHSNLGVALARKEDLDAAIREFQEVLRISPNNTIAQKNLERVLARKKVKVEAAKK